MNKIQIGNISYVPIILIFFSLYFIYFLLKNQCHAEQMPLSLKLRVTLEYNARTYNSITSCIILLDGMWFRIIYSLSSSLT